MDMTMYKQEDLVNHLFAQLERLGDEDMGEEQMKAEIERAKAMTNVASQINSSRALSLKAAMFMDKSYDVNAKLPEGF